MMMRLVKMMMRLVKMMMRLVKVMMLIKMNDLDVEVREGSGYQI